MEKQESQGLYLIRLLCFLAVFHPNCTRCCPTGFGSCQCNWAWENCPAESNGCGSCGSSSSAAGLDDPSAISAPEAGASQSSGRALLTRTDGSAGIASVEPAGTLAFVTTDSGTFVVAALAAADRVRVVRVDANALDEDPLTVRTVGSVALRPGDSPGRVIDDRHGRALVVLRGSDSIVALDPLQGAIVERYAACASPRAVAVDDAGIAYVACASGEVVNIRLSDGTETRRVTTGALDDIAVSGNSLIASGSTRLIVGTPSGTLAARETGSVVGVTRSSGDDMFVTLASELGTVTVDGFEPLVSVSALVTDFAIQGDTTAIVADGDVLLRARPDVELLPVGALGDARAVAIGDVGSRRVVAVQTVNPRMLSVFTPESGVAAGSFESLEP
jgi:hypothetical protein